MNPRALLLAPVQVAALHPEHVEIRIPEHLTCARCAEGSGCGADRTLIRPRRASTFSISRRQCVGAEGSVPGPLGLTAGSPATIAIPRAGLMVAACALLGVPGLGFLIGAALGGEVLVTAAGWERVNGEAAGAVAGLALAVVSIRLARRLLRAPAWLSPRLLLDSKEK